MQKVTLIGNLGKDAEERTTTNGVSVLTFSLAVKVTKEAVLWYDCAVWGEKILLFKGLIPYLKKGSHVCVMADLAVPEILEDRQGIKRVKMRVTPFSINFVNSNDRREKEVVAVADDLEPLPF